MREIKFRAWNPVDKEIINDNFLNFADDDYILMQFTGIKDKNGVEIYELMEIDNKFKVEFKNGSYVLTSISTGDILCPLFDYLETTRNAKITREYSEI